MGDVPTSIDHPPPPSPSTVVSEGFVQVHRAGVQVPSLGVACNQVDFVVDFVLFNDGRSIDRRSTLFFFLWSIDHRFYTFFCNCLRLIFIAFRDGHAATSYEKSDEVEAGLGNLGLNWFGHVQMVDCKDKCSTNTMDGK